jgi:hypothetical protein
MLMNVACFAFLYVSMLRTLLSAAWLSEVSLALEIAGLADLCADADSHVLGVIPAKKAGMTPEFKGK